MCSIEFVQVDESGTEVLPVVSKCDELKPVVTEEDLIAATTKYIRSLLGSTDA